MIELNKFQQHIADELGRIRYEKELPAYEVAKRAGVNVMTVYKYELNKVPNMILATLVKLLNAYDIPIDIFFERVSALTQKER